MRRGTTRNTILSTIKLEYKRWVQQTGRTPVHDRLFTAKILMAGKVGEYPSVSSKTMKGAAARTLHARSSV